MTVAGEGQHTRPAKPRRRRDEVTTLDIRNLAERIAADIEGLDTRAGGSDGFVKHAVIVLLSRRFPEYAGTFMLAAIEAKGANRKPPKP